MGRGGGGGGGGGVCDMCNTLVRRFSCLYIDTEGDTEGSCSCLVSIFIVARMN